MFKMYHIVEYNNCINIRYTIMKGLKITENTEDMKGTKKNQLTIQANHLDSQIFELVKLKCCGLEPIKKIFFVYCKVY